MRALWRYALVRGIWNPGGVFAGVRPKEPIACKIVLRKKRKHAIRKPRISLENVWMNGSVIRDLVLNASIPFMFCDVWSLRGVVKLHTDGRACGKRATPRVPFVASTGSVATSTRTLHTAQRAAVGITGVCRGGQVVIGAAHKLTRCTRSRAIFSHIALRARVTARRLAR